MVVVVVKAGAIIVLVSADPPMLPRLRPPFRVKQVVVGVELCIANSLLASLRILKIVGKLFVSDEFTVSVIANREKIIIYSKPGHRRLIF